MSTRIYQGVRLKTTSLAKVQVIVEEFRPWVVAQAEARFDTFISNLEAEGKSWREAYDIWQDRRRRIKTTGQRDPFIDTEFSLSILPSGRNMLGIVYTEQRPWLEAFYAHPGVEEYGYWDNTDGLEDVSEQAWEGRRRAWDVLKDGPVSMQSFSIELVNPNGPLPKHLREQQA